MRYRLSGSMLLASVLFVASSFALPLPQPPTSSFALEDFDSWVVHYNVSFADHSVRRQAMRIYEQNALRVLEHNARADSTYTMALNQFAAMSPEEWSRVMLMRKRPSSPPPAPELPRRSPNASNPPAVVDWRKSNLVTPVKDQGYCGSCWAFSATAALESAHSKAAGKLVALSEQMLVACSHYEANSGCDGGDPRSAYHDLESWDGQELETVYPYEKATYNGKSNGKCKMKAKDRHIPIRRFSAVAPMGSVAALETAVAQHGPVSVCINVKEEFAYYSGGIYDPKGCRESWFHLNHCVTVVGYNNDHTPSYWIIKNSYGKSWGEHGFMRLHKSGDNVCGIATEATVAFAPANTG